MLNAAITQAHIYLFQGLVEDAQEEAILGGLGKEVTAPADDGGLVSALSEIIASLRWASIIFAVILVILVGFYIMGNVVGNNSQGAAGNLKKVGWVLVGLIVIFQAPTIVGLFI